MEDKKVLNKEQLQAIKYGKGPLLIIAGAGTGKTTVITERIKYLISSSLAKPVEILALTFTEKASSEMEERIDKIMPYGYTQMWISTFHSFCDRVLRDEAIHIGLNAHYVLMTEAESILLIRKNLYKFDLDYFRPSGNPNKFLNGLVNHFSRLKDEDISPKEYFRWASTKYQVPSTKNNINKDEERKNMELARAYQKYEELKIKENVMDFGDLISNTLKLFRLRKNILQKYQHKFKYILVDEFQDTNISQNILINLLIDKQRNLTVVADDDQCLPPNTKIATLAGTKKIKLIKAGDQVITAVGKGYTSTSQVIRVFNNKKKARFLTFKTKAGKEITVTDNHKMFCLVPNRVYGEKKFYYIYLMERKGLGWRLGITNDLAQRLRLERSADRIIGIKSCKSEEEARYYETYYSLKYKLPTVCFKAREGAMIKDDWLIKLYKVIDSYKNVKILAEDLNIDLDSHHCCLGAVVRGNKIRIKINLRICKRKYRVKSAGKRLLINPQIRHEVNLETCDKKTILLLTKKGLNLYKSKKGFKIRKVFSDLKKAGVFADRLVAITKGILDVKFDVAKRGHFARQAQMMSAGNVLPGLYLPILKKNQIIFDEIVSLKEEIKKQEVYDLEIDKSHNFIADGIVVHNSIYKWRGAAVSNVLQFRKIYQKAKIITLIKNYRSTQEILNRSYDLIQKNNPDRLEIKEKINKKLIAVRNLGGKKIKFILEERVENEAETVIKEIEKLVNINKRPGLNERPGLYSYSDMAILVRANNHSDAFVRAMLRHNIPFQFLGPGRLFKQEEVKDLIAYLKVLYNFEDNVAFFRILSMPVFNLMARDIAALRNYAKKCNISFFEAAENYGKIAISSISQEQLKNIINMIHRHLALMPKDTAGQILYYFLENTGILKQLADYKSQKDEAKAQNIAKFFDKLKSYEADHEDAGVEATVDWINLKMEMGESPLAGNSDWVLENKVNILTIHSAKGLEFPVVFMVNLVADRFPTRERKEQIPIPEELIKEILPIGDYHEQEERRLFYVAMTRARDFLYFTSAKFYGEGKRIKKISPFVFEALGNKLVTNNLQPVTDNQLSIFNFKPIKETSYQLPVISYKLNYLSYSQIESFKRCPLQYKYQTIIGIPVPANSAASFGISIHNALKKYYQLIIDATSFAPLSFRAIPGLSPGERGNLSSDCHVAPLLAMTTDKFVDAKKLNMEKLLNLLKENWQNQGYSSKAHENAMFKKGIKMLENYYHKVCKIMEKPISVEQKFTIKINNLKIGGRIDRIDDLGKGVIEIIDYKTGKIVNQKDADKSIQMSIYALACIDPWIFKKKLDEVKLSFYFLDANEKVTTKRTKQDLENTKKEILKTTQEIETSDFLAKPNRYCDFCNYKLLCPAWQ